MDGLLGSLELEDPGDWPSSFPHLREIDQLLRCPICKEYFETAMVTSGCGHTFCSLCVRRCLTQETKCPSCRVVLTESDLRPSRIVDSLMRAFRSGRQALLSRLALDAADSGSTKEENIRKRQRIHTRSTTARKLGPVSSDADSVLVSNNETATVSADSDVADDNDSRIKVDEDSQDADYIDSDSDFASESRALQSKDSTVKCPSGQFDFETD
ncbi:E3 ubiquitin-protein ligase rad18 [Coemansia sp. RSA 1843]|nr:E3 ubiquitin-protein ligase rad18 [Coemansia sp. RSA 1843]